MTNLDYPGHRRILCASIVALHGIVNQRVNLGRAQVVQVGQDLQRGGAMALARIA